MCYCREDRNCPWSALSGPRPAVCLALVCSEPPLDRRMHILAQLTAPLPRSAKTSLALQYISYSALSFPGTEASQELLIAVSHGVPAASETDHSFSFWPIPSDFSVWVLTCPPCVLQLCGSRGRKEKPLGQGYVVGEDAVLCVAPEHSARVGCPCFSVSDKTATSVRKRGCGCDGPEVTGRGRGEGGGRESAPLPRVSP